MNSYLGTCGNVGGSLILTQFSKYLHVYLQHTSGTNEHSNINTLKWNVNVL